MIQRFQSRGLFLFSTLQDKHDQGMAMIGRNVHLGNGCRANTRVRHFVADQFFEFLPETGRKSLIAVRVQSSGYLTSNPVRR